MLFFHFLVSIHIKQVCCKCGVSLTKILHIPVCFHYDHSDTVPESLRIHCTPYHILSDKVLHSTHHSIFQLFFFGKFPSSCLNRTYHIFINILCFFIISLCNRNPRQCQQKSPAECFFFFLWLFCLNLCIVPYFFYIFVHFTLQTVKLFCRNKDMLVSVTENL